MPYMVEWQRDLHPWTSLLYKIFFVIISFYNSYSINLTNSAGAGLVIVRGASA